MRIDSGDGVFTPWNFSTAKGIFFSLQTRNQDGQIQIMGGWETTTNFSIAMANLWAAALPWWENFIVGCCHFTSNDYCGSYFLFTDSRWCWSSSLPAPTERWHTRCTHPCSIKALILAAAGPRGPSQIWLFLGWPPKKQYRHLPTALTAASTRGCSDVKPRVANWHKRFMMIYCRTSARKRPFTCTFGPVNNCSTHQAANFIWKSSNGILCTLAPGVFATLHATVQRFCKTNPRIFFHDAEKLTELVERPSSFIHPCTIADGMALLVLLDHSKGAMANKFWNITSKPSSLILATVTRTWNQKFEIGGPGCLNVKIGNKASIDSWQLCTVKPN